MAQTSGEMVFGLSEIHHGVATGGQVAIGTESVCVTHCAGQCPGLGFRFGFGSGLGLGLGQVRFGLGWVWSEFGVRTDLASVSGSLC